MRNQSEVDNIKYMLDVAQDGNSSKKSIKKLNKGFNPCFKWMVG